MCDVTEQSSRLVDAFHPSAHSASDQATL